MKQRSTEWFRARAGMVTASRFKDILTGNVKRQFDLEAAKDGTWSRTAEGYAEQIVAELLTGEPARRFTSAPTDWGREWEEQAFTEAAAEISHRLNETVKPPEGEFAFITHPEHDLIGCSPDGIVGDDALLELKCPYDPAVHVRTVREGYMPKQHTAQVQGSLWITGRSKYWFGSYDPRLRGAADPLFLLPIKRDDEYINDLLAPAVLAFRDWVLDLFEEFPELVRRYQTS